MQKLRTFKNMNFGNYYEKATRWYTSGFIFNLKFIIYAVLILEPLVAKKMRYA